MMNIGDDLERLNATAFVSAQRAVCEVKFCRLGACHQSDPIHSSTSAPIWFSGIPQALRPHPFLVPILYAPLESYASDATSDDGANELVDVADKGDEGLWAGSQMCAVIVQ